MGLIFGEELLSLCGVSGSWVCEADSEASDGCLVSEEFLEIDGLECFRSIAPLRILLIASVGLEVVVRVYPIATEERLSIGG